MPYKRRNGSKQRDGQITDAAVTSFEEGLRLRRRERWSTAIAANALALAIALGMKPWNPDVFDCDDGTPPDDMRTDMEIADYHRSRGIRLDLEQALRERRRAARMARRAAKAAEAVQAPG